jgi:death on curing protein
MRRKLTRIGNSWGLILPREILDLLGASGGEVELEVAGVRSSSLHRTPPSRSWRAHSATSPPGESGRTCTGALPSRYLTNRLVLAIHRDQIERFGGEPGIADEGLLDSALERPRAEFGGQLLHPTIHDQAAAYLVHVVKNYPFVDGNKPVAFAAMDVFLRLIGLRLDLTDEETYRLVVGVASSTIAREDLVVRLREAARPA